MALLEQIQHSVQKLPPTIQIEVLDYVEYLLAKSDRREELEWSELSLALAMRGMEDEAGPEYTLADLRVVFA